METPRCQDDYEVLRKVGRGKYSEATWATKLCHETQVVYEGVDQHLLQFGQFKMLS